MKKHLVLIMNIVLIAAVCVALAFTVARLTAPGEASPDEPIPARHFPTEAEIELPSVSDEERYRVGVVRLGSDANSDSCYAGFISQLRSRGLFDNLDLSYIIESDSERFATKINRLIEDDCDLIYAIGPSAAQYAAAATSEIPIVFAAVSDPEEMGLIASNEAPGGNVTGVSSYTPCFEQIDLIPVLLPKADSVAAIYNSTDENAVRQAIIACWEAEDFRYTADRYPVSNKESLLKALDEIRDKGTDVIYVPIDSLMSRNISTVVAFSLDNNIPVICGDRAMLNAGCLATCEINYTSIGRRCADMSCEILFAKKDPATMSVIYKYDCYNIVNEQTLNVLDIRLSSVALANVEIVDCSK